MQARDWATSIIGVGILAATGAVVQRQRPGLAAAARTAIARAATALSGDPDTVTFRPAVQRFRMRRAAVAAMRADLRRLVVAESTFTVDSGHPAAFLPPAYGFAASPGNIWVIQVRARGWWASISNPLTSISCAVFVGTVDTMIAGARPGESTCRGWPGRRSGL